MVNTAISKSSTLTDEERTRFEYHSNQIRDGIKKGQEARNEVITHVLTILNSNPPLWREHYESEEDYVKTELNIEMSSFWRNVKDNKNYLYLIGNTEDVDEQISLSRMRSSAYRELRQLATDNKPLLKKGGESDEDYRNRLEEKEKEDSILIQELWSEVYKRISKFKRESDTGIYPNGGYSITARDISETCLVLQRVMEVPKLLNDGVKPSDIAISTLEGKDISLQEVIDTGNKYASQVIEAVTDLGVSEALTEKLKRQNTHIQDSLEKRYKWDQYPGILIYEDGRLKIQNQYVTYDLLEEWSDLLNKETSISIRRTIRQI